MTLAGFVPPASDVASADDGADFPRRTRDRDHDSPSPTVAAGGANASADAGLVEARCAEFVDAATRTARMAHAAAAGALTIEVDFAVRTPTPPRRMADALDEAIERALAARGAPDGGWTGEARTEPSVRLGDQLHRARRVGARSLCLALVNVRALIDADGALAPADARALRFWAGRALEQPVHVVLDAADADVPAHAAPIPLGAALAMTSRGNGAIPTTVGAPMSVETSPRFAAKNEDTASDMEPRKVESAAPTKVTSGATQRPPTVVVSTAPRFRVAVDEATKSALARPSPRASMPTPTKASSMPTPSPSPSHATRPLITNGIAVGTDEDRWRSWMLALYAARGPQSLASFERLFAEAYVPLARALAEGLDAPKAIQAVDEFRRNFARMYAEACPTFALTGKRPRMVMDAWEHAGKLARLHNARGTQLLLVDGMRWDVGQDAKAVAVEQLGARASLADERILWAALPTTTPRQLATLARGIDALRSDDEGEGESEPVRGRTADVVRRVKVGSRDLYKLDLVEARLNQMPLPEIARATGEAIARHASVLPPRTLLFVFGDHGFRGGNGASPADKADHGGTSPEEVLVPSFAFMLGELH